MKTQHQPVGFAVALPVALHIGSQRGNVASVVVVVVDKAQFGNAPGALCPLINRIQHAGRGGGRILRIGRQHQHTGYAIGLECIQLRGNGRAAVAHGPAHLHLVLALPQPALQQLGLLVSPEPQRRALRRSRCWAYLAADLAGRVRKIMPCRINSHSKRGISTTRRSLKNSRK